MGYVRFVCLAVAALLAVPAPVEAQAQQENDAAPVYSLPPSRTVPPVPSRQQGPELDPFRAPATQPATPPPVIVPPVVAPTVTPPPVPVPTPDRDSAPDPPPRRAAPADPAPSPAERRAAPDNAAIVPNPAPAPQPVPDASNSAAPVETAPSADAPTPWPWMIGGALALLALGGALMLRRRQRTSGDAPVDEPVPPAAPQAPTPAPPAPPPPAPDTAPRPWLAMDLIVTQARYSLVGVTIAYDLLLHNRGDAAATDLLVRGIIGNAGQQQQALLDDFFTGQSGLPLHATVSILPDETRRVSGELRLEPDQIVPVSVGQRSLLIPIAAFDASYHWGPDDAEPTGNGRTARAFIIGQDQEPPADRLAPFRLDQGPRQYRRTATRAVAELTAT